MPFVWFYNFKSTEIDLQEHTESISHYFKSIEETQTFLSPFLKVYHHGFGSIFM